MRSAKVRHDASRGAGRRSGRSPLSLRASAWDMRPNQSQLNHNAAPMPMSSSYTSATPNGPAPYITTKLVGLVKFQATKWVSGGVDWRLKGVEWRVGGGG